MPSESRRRSDAPRLVLRCTAGHERPYIDAEDAEGTCRAPGWLAGWCGCRMSVVEVPSDAPVGADTEHTSRGPNEP